MTNSTDKELLQQMANALRNEIRCECYEPDHECPRCRVLREYESHQREREGAQGEVVGWWNGRTFYEGATQPGLGTKNAKYWRPLQFAEMREQSEDDWDSRKLGADERFVRVSSKETDDAVQDALGLPRREQSAQQEPKNLFARDDIVQHRKGGVYIIIGRCTIEATMADCYAYRGEDGRLWIRAVSEMEDGRFTRVLMKPHTAPVTGSREPSAEHWKKAMSEVLSPRNIGYVERRARELAAK